MNLIAAFGIAIAIAVFYYIVQPGSASTETENRDYRHTIELSEGTVITTQVSDRNQHLVRKYGKFFNSTIKPILIDAFESGSLDKNEMQRKFRHTVHTFYNNQNLIEGYKQDKIVNKVEVVAVEDERTCNHCKHHHGNTFPVEKAPTIPHHNCANLKSGNTTDSCRCTLNGVV